MSRRLPVAEGVLGNPGRLCGACQDPSSPAGWLGPGTASVDVAGGVEGRGE
jgi:hypothetical protein